MRTIPAPVAWTEVIGGPGRSTPACRRWIPLIGSLRHPKGDEMKSRPPGTWRRTSRVLGTGAGGAVQSSIRVRNASELPFGRPEEFFSPAEEPGSACAPVPVAIAHMHNKAVILSIPCPNCMRTRLNFNCLRTQPCARKSPCAASGSNTSAMNSHGSTVAALPHDAAKKLPKWQKCAIHGDEPRLI